MMSREAMASRKVRSRQITLHARPQPIQDDHQRMIAERAYYRAERRGFESGHDLEDWLAAEQEFIRDCAPA